MRYSVVAVVLLLLFSFIGCVHTSTGTPATPWEKVSAYNATFAQINEEIEQGAENLASSGVLSKDKAHSIIVLTYQVADIHGQITAILGKGVAITSGDITTINSLLDQINASAAVLIGDASLGVKNPTTQNLLTADIQGLVNLAKTILSLLPQLQSNPTPTAVPTTSLFLHGGVAWV